MKQLTLRLDDDLHTLLKEAAKREHRSMHAEIIRLLEQALKDNTEKPSSS